MNELYHYGPGEPLHGSMEEISIVALEGWFYQATVWLYNSSVPHPTREFTVTRSNLICQECEHPRNKGFVTTFWTQLPIPFGDKGFWRTSGIWRDRAGHNIVGEDDYAVSGLGEEETRLLMDRWRSNPLAILAEGEL